jgi:predicted GNAT family N-acyltransferase
VSEEPDEVRYRIEPLNDKHDRSAFSCGVEPLDRYLQKQAGQDARKRVAAVFILTADGRTVAGYYTLSAHVVNLGDLPAAIARKLPRYPNVPATLLGRLAVGMHFRGQRLGEFLLLDALRRVLVSTREIASAMVVVDAKDEDARNFYLHHDFVPLPTQPNRLFYTVGTIENLFETNPG